MHLTDEISGWAAVVLIPKSSGEALYCAAHYQLPDDWAALDNRLDSGSMNATAYLSQEEQVDNDAKNTAPPTNQAVSYHSITASAVVLVPSIGTLEVLADRQGYRFGDKQLQAMRLTAAAISQLVSKS
jgi:hypothetical protein